MLPRGHALNGSGHTSMRAPVRFVNHVTWRLARDGHPDLATWRRFQTVLRGLDLSGNPHRLLMIVGIFRRVTSPIPSRKPTFGRD